MRRLGIPVSNTTILAGLKQYAKAPSESSAGAAVHVAGVDDWAWRKGSNYGTIIVDLECRAVVGGHCHVRAFYLSSAPGVRRPG
jgi:hypothetical protein